MLPFHDRPLIGLALAMTAARTLVVYVIRSGGQAQFSVFLRARTRVDARVAELDEWIAGNLTARLDPATRAVRTGMSDSSFRRHSRAATGRTPRQTVGVLRLDAPSQPLLSGPQSFRNISRMVGGDSETALPWLFRTHYGLTG